MDERQPPAKRVLLCSSSQSQIRFALTMEWERRWWDRAAGVGGTEGASSLVSQDKAYLAVLRSGREISFVLIENQLFLKASR